MSVLLLAVIVAAYGQSLHSGFVWDDTPALIDNPKVHNMNQIGAIFSEPFGHTEGVKHSAYYRPVVSLSNLFIYLIAQDNATPYHLFNLLVHWLVCVEVFVLVLLLFQNTTLSAGTAVLFALHPSHVASVAWISGRSDLLCAFFTLGAMLLFLAAHDKPWHHPNKLLSHVLFLGALGSKELAYVYPAALLLAQSATSKWSAGEFLRRLDGKHYLITAILLATFIVIHHLAVGQIGQQAIPLDLSQSLASFLARIGHYVQVLVLPIGLKGFYYFDATGGRVLTGMGIAIFSVILFYISSRRRDTAIVFGLGWFCLFLAPVLGITPVPSQYAATDHMMYLPSMGGLIIIVASLLKALAKLVGARMPLLAVSSLSACYLALCLHLAPIWKNDISLFETLIRAYPKETIHYIAVSHTLILQKDYEYAEKILKKGLSHNPKNWELWFLLGDVAVNQDQYDRGQDLLERASSLDGADSRVYNNLGNIFFMKKDYGRAYENYKRALELNGRHYESLYNIAQVLERSNHFDEALTYYRRFYDMAPAKYEPQKSHLRKRFAFN
jgi:hypothetical protein